VAEISSYKLTAAMAAVSRLKAELASQDSDMILASIESETNALELMDRVIEAVVADELMVEQGSARLKRIEARANRHRLILRAMMEQIAEKVERPLATLSISYRTKPIITDASRLPPELMRTAPDMTALARALKDGAVAGAELSNPSPVLTLRTA
jgi:hypothetical protein